MREFYFATELDLGSSGLRCYSYPEFCAVTGFSTAELEDVAFDDSQTFGAPELREAIARQWGDGRAETVLLGNGSNEIGFLVMNALLEPGDEVIALEPIYHTLGRLPEAIGCTVKPWPIRYEDGWQPDFATLKAMLTPRTRVVTVNFPHNPTGISLTRAQLDTLLELVSSVGAHLVWDAAFEDLVHNGEPLPNPFCEYDRCVSTYTMSKCFGLPGSRLGWAFCPPGLFENLELLKDYMSLYVSPVTEAMGLAAVRHADALRQGRMEQAERNLAHLETWIQAHQSHLDWVPPMGGVTAFPRLKHHHRSDVFCRELAREEGVMMVPGTCFENPSHVRLGFGGDCDAFEEGLNRLSRFLGSH